MTHLLISQGDSITGRDDEHQKEQSSRKRDGRGMCGAWLPPAVPRHLPGARKAGPTGKEMSLRLQ